MPAGAVDRQDGETRGPGTGFAGEEREQFLEERLGDTVGEVPEGLAALRRNEGGNVEPLEAMMAEGHRARGQRGAQQRRLNGFRASQCSSPAKTSMGFPGWCSAASATAAASFF